MVFWNFDFLDDDLAGVQQKSLTNDDTRRGTYSLEHKPPQSKVGLSYSFSPNRFAASFESTSVQAAASSPRPSPAILDPFTATKVMIPMILLPLTVLPSFITITSDLKRLTV